MNAKVTSPSPRTLGELLAWSYANLAMAHAAVTDGALRYGPKHYAIRTRLHKGLLAGTLQIRSLAHDERLKMILPQSCCYCGSSEALTIDHLIPKGKGGSDHGENLVWACRPCNSSKQAVDVLAWFERKGEFPPLLLLRRHLKIVHQYCQHNGLLDASTEEPGPVPFSVSSIPTRFPSPPAMRLWVASIERPNPSSGFKAGGHADTDVCC